MGSTNKTTYYELSQFIGDDKPAWLQDYNGDMAKIDSGINAAKVAADAAATSAAAAQGDATTALSDIATLSSTVGTLVTDLGTISGAINTINSLIGNGTPTTTDQTIIGAINELHADQGDLDDLDTPDKDSFAGAINNAYGSTILHQINGDGINTISDLLDLIHDHIYAIAPHEAGSYFDDMPKYYIRIGGTSYRFTRITYENSVENYRFIAFNVDTSSVYDEILIISPSGSKWLSAAISSGGVNISDLASQVASATLLITLERMN